MTLQLQQIDELLRPERSFLTEEDHCFFLREYTAGAGFGYGETNNIISNLKKKLDRRGKSEWRYKEVAIQRAGNELREALYPPDRHHLLERGVSVVNGGHESKPR